MQDGQNSIPYYIMQKLCYNFSKPTHLLNWSYSEIRNSVVFLQFKLKVGQLVVNE